MWLGGVVITSWWIGLHTVTKLRHQHDRRQVTLHIIKVNLCCRMYMYMCVLLECAHAWLALGIGPKAKQKARQRDVNVGQCDMCHYSSHVAGY